MELKNDCDKKSAAAKRALEMKKESENQAKLEELKKASRMQIFPKKVFDKIFGKFDSKKCKDRNRKKIL